MNSGSGSGWTYHDPTVRRTPRFAAVLEQVVAKVARRFVIFEQAFSLRMLSEKKLKRLFTRGTSNGRFAKTTYVAVAAVEDVQGTVVVGGLEVIDVILHFHLHAVPFVVFAAFELLIAVLFR